MEENDEGVENMVPPRPIIIAGKRTDETVLSSTAADALIKYFEDNNVEPYTLIGARAQRPLLSSILAKAYRSEDRPLLIIYIGHGDTDSLYGNMTSLTKLVKRTRLVVENVNDGSLAGNGNIIYAFACLSLLSLGKDIVKKGAGAYFGAKGEMFFKVLDTPHDDDYTNDYCDIATLIPRLLFEGKTTGEALMQYYDRVNYFLDLYQQNYDITGEFQKYYLTMEANRDMFGLFGNHDLRWWDPE